MHGAHFFQHDHVDRKTVAQLEVWKCLSESMREFNSVGPDLPKRAAALAAEAKVLDFLALAKTFTKDPSLFELGTPDQIGDYQARQQPPDDKANNLEKVMSIAQKALLALDG